MIHYFTRIASLVLAFGFFISCSVLNSSHSGIKPSDKLSETEIQQKLNSINDELSSDSSNADLYYKKGVLLTDLAQKKTDPSERTSIYRQAEQSLQQAADIYQDSSDDEKVHQLLKVTWSNEHNNGVQLMQSDSSSQAPNYERAASFFRNATAVIPDSSISYKMEARAYYKNDQPRKAIQVLEEARRNISRPPSLLLEQLAYLYLENDQPPKAIEVYEEAKAHSDQNVNLIHGLSNAYIKAGNHERAVKMLKLLTKNEPKNVIYHQRLATELYQWASEKLGNTAQALNNGTQLPNTSYATADSLVERATSEFQTVNQQLPKDWEQKREFAFFYQDIAAKYQKLLPLVESQQQQAIHSKIQHHLESSLPLLEEISREHPDDRQLWQSLYNTYSYLGMEEKANNAKSNL